MVILTASCSPEAEQTNIRFKTPATAAEGTEPADGEGENEDASDQSQDVTDSEEPVYVPPEPAVVIISASSSITSDNPITITITFSEAVTDFTTNDINVTGAAITNFTGSGSSYSIELTPDQPGVITVDVPAGSAIAADGAENTASSQFSIAYTELIPPTAVLANIPANPTNNDSYDIDVLDLNGVVSYQYVLLNDSSSCTTATYNGSWIEEGTNITGSLNEAGIWQLCVIGRDTNDLTQAAADATNYSWQFDNTVPTVTGVASTTAAGVYKDGDTIAIQITFSENVAVVGQPQLMLATGNPNKVATYNTGSGTTELTFQYTVEAGDNTVDLDYSTNEALSLNNGSIGDNNGNAATLTLPAPGAAGSLAANAQIELDTIAPTVTAVTADQADGSYHADDTITIIINTSETVTVSGSPQLTLATGVTNAIINFTTGNGTSSLSFAYEVQPGDASSDLDYTGTNALSLNNGSITDAAGNTMNLELPSPAAAGSLGANKDLVIDTTAAAPTGFEPLPGFDAEGIPLSWTNGTGGNGPSAGVVIYRQQTGNGDITWTPTDGSTYTTASDVTDNDASGKIIYAGSDSSYQDKTSLTTKTTYMYKIFGYNAAHKYTTGLQRLSRSYSYKSLDLGSWSNCATRFGRVRCWGNNTESANLGYSTSSADDIGDDEHPYSAGDLNLGKDILSVRLSQSSNNGAFVFSCGLTSEGKARCWGHGADGKLGNDATTAISTFPPPDVNLSVPIIALDVGATHSCAVTNRGGVRCWGKNNKGQLGRDDTNNVGDGNTTAINTLEDINLGKTAAFVTLGSDASCAITTEAAVRCWGSGSYGKLGNNSTDDVGAASGDMSTLSDLNLDVGVTDISTHHNSTCVVTTNGGGRCWGDGATGRLGNGSTADDIDAATVIDIDLASTGSDLVATEIVHGGTSTCVVHHNGTVKCFGKNTDGQLGYGNTTNTNSNSIASLSWHDFGSRVIDLAGGNGVQGAHYCALTEDDAIYCWGDGARGALGQHSTDATGDDELATATAPSAIWAPAQATPDTVRANHLVLWFDASDTTTVYASSDCTTLASDQGNVACLKDKSSQQNHAVQGTAANQPTWAKHYQHGHHALLFDGNDGLAGTISSMTGGDTNYTLFVVYRGDDAPAMSPGHERIFQFGNADADHQLVHLTYGSWNSTESSIGHYENDRRFGEVAPQVTHVTSTRYNGTGGNDIKAWHNDVDTNTGTNGYVSNLNLATNPNFLLSHDFGGHIMEIIVYDQALPDAEREAVHAYLRAKWQKGLDGIATSQLALHLDPAKRDTVMTDTNGTNCQTTQTMAADGDEVSCVLDRSSNLDHAGNDTAIARPTLDTKGVNLMPSLLFDGSDDQLKGELTTWAGGNQPWAMQQMFYGDSLSNESSTFGMGDAEVARARFHAQITTPNQLQFGINSAALDFSGLDNLNGHSHVHSYLYRGTLYGDDTYSLLYLDGQQRQGTEPSETGTGAFPSDPGYSLGSHGDSHYFNGHITETLFYERTLSGAETTENDLYLQKKWRQLPDHDKAPGGVDAGLSLWLDASDLTTLFQDSCSTVADPVTSNNQLVGCWQDKSGRNNHGEASSGMEANYTTDAMNGRAVMDFNEDRYTSSLPSFNNGAQPHTIFIVADSDADGGSFVAIGNSSSNGEMIVVHNQGSDQLRYSFLSNELDSQIPAKHRIQQIYSVSYDGTTGHSWHNGQPLDQQGMTLNLAAVPAVGIGNQPVSNAGLTGKIAEVIIYNRHLADHERQAVEAYLAQKWLGGTNYTSCADASADGQTVTGIYYMDPDGYNGPQAAFGQSCSF